MICKLCPRECGVDRTSEVGFCGCTDLPLVASVCVHKGEEPVISGRTGICNVFFAHCNLRCMFCQNYQISRNGDCSSSWLTSYDQIVSAIEAILKTGVNSVGFVSPSHQVQQMKHIIEKLHQHGFSPIIIYNSNGYDKVETLKLLENVVDIYLPDFKYFDSSLAERCSSAPGYFDFASKSIKEMYRQKGATLIINDDGQAEWGVIIRHLVLPGCTSDSVKVLRYISEEISPKIHVSLMSQYFPPADIPLADDFCRTITTEEYNEVLNVYNELNLRGWVQDLDSFSCYQPDFSKNLPF